MDTSHQVYLVFGLDVSSYLYGYQFNQESKSINAMYIVHNLENKNKQNYEISGQGAVFSIKIW